MRKFFVVFSRKLDKQYKTNYDKECIPVGCILPASVATTRCHYQGSPSPFTEPSPLTETPPPDIDPHPKEHGTRHREPSRRNMGPYRKETSYRDPRGQTNRCKSMTLLQTLFAGSKNLEVNALPVGCCRSHTPDLKRFGELYQSARNTESDICDIWHLPSRVSVGTNDDNQRDARYIWTNVILVTVRLTAGRISYLFINTAEGFWSKNVCLWASFYFLSTQYLWGKQWQI